MSTGTSTSTISEADWTYEVIHTNQIDRCREVMNDIMRTHRPVAVDCEGMNLGRNGRMTLMQICTRENVVYLIDLIDEDEPTNRQLAVDLIYKGHVKKMLESSANEKIMHGCNRDSGALYHQFGVQLWPSRVFDTQVAEMAIQVSGGTCFPKKNKLNRIAELFRAPTTQKRRAHVSAYCRFFKDQLGVRLERFSSDFLKHFEQTSAIKENHNLWNLRPLSEQMICIACYDVLTLGPMLYNQLRRKLDQLKGWEIYRQMVGWQIDLQIEPKAVAAERKVEVHARVGKLLQKMCSRYEPSTEVNKLSPEELRVMRTLRGPGNWRKWSGYAKECDGLETILALEEAVLLSDVDLIAKRFVSSPEIFRLTYKEGRRLNVLCRHRNAQVKEAALRLKTQLQMTKEE